MGIVSVLARARLQSRGLNPCHCANLVIVGGITADSDRAEQRCAVLDQHATRHRHQAPLRNGIHRTDEVGLFLCTLEQRPRAHAERERAISLSVSNLGSHQAGSVLRSRDLDRAACIENGDDQRLHLFLDAFCQRGIENLAGDVEGKFSHLLFL